MIVSGFDASSSSKCVTQVCVSSKWSYPVCLCRSLITMCNASVCHQNDRIPFCCRLLEFHPGQLKISDELFQTQQQLSTHVIRRVTSRPKWQLNPKQFTAIALQLKRAAIGNWTPNNALQVRCNWHELQLETEPQTMRCKWVAIKNWTLNNALQLKRAAIGNWTPNNALQVRRSWKLNSKQCAAIEKRNTSPTWGSDCSICWLSLQVLLAVVLMYSCVLCIDRAGSRY